MKEEYLEILWCPDCKHDLLLKKEKSSNGRIVKGELKCANCNNVYEISNSIPRFVSYKNYAESFGSQWNAFAKSQMDTKDLKESSLRFESEIGWKKENLKGQKVLEVGSGAGRFIEVVSRNEAALSIGLDITDAVDASQNNLSDRENVLFIQGDIFNSPIRESSVDLAYSIGVLHHTPEPELAFQKMVNLVKDDGQVGLSLYEISLYSRPNKNSLKVSTMEVLWSLNLWRVEFFRMFTTKIPDRLMITYCKTIVPLLHYLNKVPVLGLLRYLLPSTCYRKLPVIWSMVDTMDTYSTKIVHQYRAKDIFQWFLRLGLTRILLLNGRAGWVSIVADKGSLATRASNSIFLEKTDGLGNIGD